MTKSRWRESIRSLGSHIDPEREEQLKNTKIEIDVKVEKIVKLIKNKNQGKKDGNLTKDSELLELIDDFHKQYQELYALYDNLRGEVKEKVQGLENKESSPSTSSSDSESYYSVDEASARSSPRHALIQRVRDDLKNKLETPSLELVDMRNKLNVISEEKEALHSEYTTALNKIQESEKIIVELRVEAAQTEITKQKLRDECTQLKEKLVERERELLSLTRAHQIHESEIPTQIKKLERQISSLKLEHKNLCTQKRDLAEQTEARTMEAKQLGEENSGLRSRISGLEIKLKEKEDTISALRRKLQENKSGSKSEIEELMARANSLQLEVDTLRTRILELEMTSKEKEDELSALQRKLEENESDSKSKIEDLMQRVKVLQLEVDNLKSKKGELEEQVVFKSNEATAQVKGFMDQVNILQQELHSLSSQKSESESNLDKVTQEISYFLVQIENLKEKLESKTMDLERMLEEKDGLERQVKDLELEAGSLRIKKSELEEQMRSKNHEADQLRVEKEGLHVRISESERLIMEKSDELSALQQKFVCLESDLSSQIKALEEELKIMNQEFDSLQAEKSQLELQIEREREESLENLARMEKQNLELTSKITQHQTTLTGQEEAINKLNEEHKQIRSQYLESKLNFQVAEKKIEETAEEFCKKFEDSLRILSRRIQVAEQLHVENKDVYRRTKEKYEIENKDFKERVASTEVAVKKMKEISLIANDMLFGLDAVALKFEQCSGNFLNRISKASCEVLFAKDWVQRKNKALKHVQEDVDCLLAQMDTKEAEVLGLREKVWKLENKVRELEKMVKEKEEGMLGMGEEKREAIRQLCVWIDYHRSRSDYLKKILMEMTAVRSQRTS
ncbi:COP1-interactive protein 1-like [Actinidia eriantha]|uniref:COP1-interactive protein 1-like n=1 Tax=Actinidia eriantha TaxID=165200 RepID=UPI0025896A41|nr:COP1-interactive protein 1-like [Actinidia eriantha]XP_057511386.1 COP1-interactive protein 1-like [Actinidia eriantha]